MQIKLYNYTEEILQMPISSAHSYILTHAVQLQLVKQQDRNYPNWLERTDKDTKPNAITVPKWSLVRKGPQVDCHCFADQLFNYSPQLNVPILFLYTHLSPYCRQRPRCNYFCQFIRLNRWLRPLNYSRGRSSQWRRRLALCMANTDYLGSIILYIFPKWLLCSN